MIFDGSPALANFSCKEAIGKNVICEDGIARRVVEIVPSHAFPYRSIINEGDEDSKSGYFVHNLSLACQLQGLPLPDKEQMEAFNRVCKSLDYNEPKNRHERRRLEARLNRTRGGLWLR